MIDKDDKSTEEKSAETKNTDTSQGDSGQESTLTEKQWEVAFKHSRFKTLNERATKAEKELNKLQKIATVSAEEKLKDEKKWQELSEKRGEEVESLQAKIVLASKTRSVIQEAVKLGIKDTDAAVKLVELADIQLDEDGKPTNAVGIVKALADAKPYLVTGSAAPDIGADVNPASTDGQKKVWAASTLRDKMRDAEWYEKHREEIDEAYAEGRVDYKK